MALSITINKVAVADYFAAGTKVADIVVSGGTRPYSYSLASGGDCFQINGTKVQVINEMNISNIQSFSVTATDNTSGTALTVTSEETYPNLTAEIQSRFNSADKIYKITQDIDLGHGILFIPSGCTLDFQGGSFTNGTIIGNYTSIKAGLESIFSASITIDGTWEISTIYSNWFKGNNRKYTETLRNIINLSNNSEIIIDKGDYYVTLTEDQESCISIKSNTIFTLNGNIRLNPNSLEACKIISIENEKNIIIQGGAFYGDVREHTGDSGEWCHGIQLRGAENIQIRNTVFDGFWGDGIAISNSGDSEEASENKMSNNIHVDNVVCSYSRRLGLSVTGAYNVWISNSKFIANGSINGTLPKAGIDVEANIDSDTNYIFIDNCNFQKNDLIVSKYVSGDLQTGKVAQVTNCIIDGNLSIAANVDIRNCTCKYLSFDKASEVDVSNCIIKEFVRFSVINKNITIRNCYISSSSRTHGYSSLISFNDAEITNIKFIECTFDLSNENGVVALTPSTNLPLGDKIPIIKCVFLGESRYFQWSLGDVINCFINASRIALRDNVRDISYIGNIIKTSSNIFVPSENIETTSYNILGNYCCSNSKGALLNKLSYTITNINIANNSYQYSSNIDSNKTTDRPNLIQEQKGYLFFDTDLNKYISWNGTAWVNMDGTALE